MPRRAWSVVFLLAGGCTSGPESTTLVPFNPFITEASKPAEVLHVVASPGSKEVTDRVLVVGGRVIAANRQIGFRPRFSTLGTTKEEIFHRGTREIFLTEGLVRRCETDGALAAVICLELGRMIAEREGNAAPQTRIRQQGAPIDMPVGNDPGGTFGPPDGTRLMELNKYVEQPRLKEPVPPPSPTILAREYLRKAGFAPTELDNVLR